jgi:hypothetical protein
MTSALNQERPSVLARSPTESGIRADAHNESFVAEGGGSSRKKKMTISLSEKSIRAFEELKRATDADTDSEVFRNALRLHLTLLRAHAAGVRLYMKRDNSEEVVPVTLFAESEKG